MIIDGGQIASFKFREFEPKILSKLRRVSNIYDLLDFASSYYYSFHKPVKNLIELIFPSALYGDYENILNERKIFKLKDRWYLPGNINNAGLWHKNGRIEMGRDFWKSSLYRQRVRCVKLGPAEGEAEDPYFRKHYYPEVMSHYGSDHTIDDSPYVSTTYYNRTEREEFRVFIANGYICRLVIDADMISIRKVSSNELVLLVLSLNGEMYTKDKIKNISQHTSLVHASPVLFAGLWQLNNGRIDILRSHSGHYTPNLDNLLGMAGYLHERRCNNLHNVKFEQIERIGFGESGIRNNRYSYSQLLREHPSFFGDFSFYIDKYQGNLQESNNN